MKTLFGSKTERDVKSLVPIVEKIMFRKLWASALSKEAFRNNSVLKSIASGTKLEELLPKTYALLEASKRVLGERPYDVQPMGSIVLNSEKSSK